jgi:hypothetical protein
MGCPHPDEIGRDRGQVARRWGAKHETRLCDGFEARESERVAGALLACGANLENVFPCVDGCCKGDGYCKGDEMIPSNWRDEHEVNQARTKGFASRKDNITREREREGESV